MKPDPINPEDRTLVPGDPGYDPNDPRRSNDPNDPRHAGRTLNEWSIADVLDKLISGTGNSAGLMQLLEDVRLHAPDQSAKAAEWLGILRHPVRDWSPSAFRPTEDPASQPEPGPTPSPRKR